jgi:hypothetical protein
MTKHQNLDQSIPATLQDTVATLILKELRVTPETVKEKSTQTYEDPYYSELLIRHYKTLLDLEEVTKLRKNINSIYCSEEDINLLRVNVVCMNKGVADELMTRKFLGCMKDVLLKNIIEYEHSIRFTASQGFVYTCDRYNIDNLLTKDVNEKKESDIKELLKSKSLVGRLFCASVIMSYIDSWQQFLERGGRPRYEFMDETISVEQANDCIEKCKSFLDKYLPEEAKLVASEGLSQCFAASQSQQEGMAR